MLELNSLSRELWRRRRCLLREEVAVVREHAEKPASGRPDARQVTSLRPVQRAHLRGQDDILLSVTI